MRTYWSNRRYALLRKLVHEATYPGTLYAVTTELHHVTTRTTTNEKLGSHQATQGGKGITHIDIFSIDELMRAHLDEPDKITVDYNSDNKMSLGRVLITPNMD